MIGLSILAIWLLGFLVALVFVPRMARFIYDGRGYDFPHTANKDGAVWLAVVGALLWPLVALAVLGKFWAEVVFEDRPIREPRKRQFPQGEVWKVKDGDRYRVMVAGVSLDGALILQRLDHEHNLLTVTPEQLLMAYEPAGETRKVRVERGAS